MLNLNLNISAGFQYFPLSIPKALTDNQGIEMVPADQFFWYACGPASYLELKIIVGKLF